MRQLILHIGTHKTGTTALQHYLLHNQEALQAIGWYYPTTGIPPGHIFGHRDLAWSALKGNAEAFEELAAELHPLPSQMRCVISSEEFEFCKNLDDLRARLEPYDVTVILYLRRQDDLLLSEYSENLRGGSHFAGNLTQFEKRMSLAGRFDYVALCRRWSDAFGPGSLKVRIYTPTVSIVDDFCLTAGIDRQSLSAPPSNVVNPRIDARLTGAFRVLNQLRLNGLDEATCGAIHETLMQQTTRMKAGKTKYCLLSPRERARYLKKHKKSNNELLSTFLAGESFANPLQENAGEVRANPESIDREIVLAILMAALVHVENKDRHPPQVSDLQDTPASSLEGIAKLSKNLRMMIGRKS